MRKKKIESQDEEQLITQKEYHEEIEEDILNYSLSAIVRAIPDARDGLKPVHRRILYAMKTDHNTYDKPYRKSIKGVGSTMSRFHPHGDSSVYDAMIRLGQNFKMGECLVDGHGNLGSIDGDPCAASRYTETRLTEFAECLLQDVEKSVVPMVDNFDGTEKEPLILPAQIPHALVNGNQGIAVGITTNTPPHNLGEVVDAFIYYLDHKRVSLKALLEIMPGPDFPTGGIIINQNDLENLYRFGQGRVITRAKMELERHTKDKDSLIVTEIPYASSGAKTKIVDTINDLIISKRLPELIEVRDESNKEGIRINIVLKKNMTQKEINKLQNKLFKLTPLEASESYIFMFTVDLRPRQLGLLDYFKIYHEFQREVVKKKYEFLLKKYLARKEVLDGLTKAIDMIDVVVEVARYSKNSKAIKKCLMEGDITGINFKTKSFATKAKKFNFTEIQANAIMAIRLEQLSGLEIKSIQDEAVKLDKDIAQAEAIIKSDKLIDSEIKKTMLAIKKKFAKPRKTKITNAKQADFKEEKVVTDLFVTVDKFGYIKTVDTIKDITDDFIFAKETKSDDKVLFFAEDGNVYRVKIEDLLKQKAGARGTLISTLFDGAEVKILHTMFESELSKAKLLFISSDILIKVVPGSEFIANKRILKATNLSEDAYVTHVVDIENKKEIDFVTTKDRTVVKPIKEVQEYKKNSRGVQGLRFRKDEEVDNIIIK